MFIGDVDCGPHIVRQDDKLRWPAVIMGAKADDVDLSHGGRTLAKKPGESKRGRVHAGPAARAKSHRTGSALNTGLGGMLQCFKLVSAGLGEWLKRIFMSSVKSELSKLFPGYVRPEIVL